MVRGWARFFAKYRCAGGGWVSDVKQGGEKFGVNALAFEQIAFGQNRDRIMGMQAFLMAGHNAEIADAGVLFELLGEKARRVFDEDRVGGIEFGECLFILTFDHHLGFRGNGPAGKVDQIFEPQAIRPTQHFDREACNRALRMRRGELTTELAGVLGKLKRAGQVEE